MNGRGEVPMHKVIDRLDDIKGFLRLEAELPEEERIRVNRFFGMLGQHLGELNKRWRTRTGDIYGRDDVAPARGRR